MAFTDDDRFDFNSACFSLLEWNLLRDGENADLFRSLQISAYKRLLQE